MGSGGKGASSGTASAVFAAAAAWFEALGVLRKSGGSGAYSAAVVLRSDPGAVPDEEDDSPRG